MNLFGIKKSAGMPAAQPIQASQPGTPAAQTGGTPPQATPAPAVKNGPSASSVLDDGTVSLSDILSPSSVEVDFKYIRVGEKFMRTLFVVGYPRYVTSNWLEPLINFDHQLDIAMFIYPTAANDVLSDLRRKIAEMEATIASEMEAGRVVDPKTTAALEDALGLQEELAKGVERFFLFSLYITISSESLKELDEATKKLVTSLASILLLTKTATLQMEEGFKTTLPLGRDMLYITRNMDTTSLASTFPFTSAMLTQDKGVLYGINQQNGSLIIFDRFSLENANEVVLGKSGAGKSYLIKIEVIRQLMFGAEVVIVDPEGEYETLAETLGGEALQFSANSPVKINPFDLAGVYEEGENELGLKILSLFGLLKIITGDLDPAHDAILDRALVETYRQKGITTDPATQKLEPPLMEDLYKVLLGMEDANARELALRLEKFIKGSLAGIFNQQSNFDINKQFTVFSLKGLEEELRPIAMHIILDFVWTKVRKDLKKRVLILDEAWYMMKYQDSASFVYGIAKRARKYYLGMTTATQDVEDFMSTDYGKAVLTNSSIQMLLKQGTAEVDLISKTFFLSEGERELLISADVGEGLFFAGQNHVAMKVIAAAFEHEIATSNPVELSKRAEEKKAQAGEETPPLSSASSDTSIPGVTPPPTSPQPPVAPTETNATTQSAPSVTPPPSQPSPATPEVIPGVIPPTNPPSSSGTGVTGSNPIPQV
jgi:type IV secretory pathway VirB4 component